MELLTAIFGLIVFIVSIAVAQAIFDIRKYLKLILGELRKRPSFTAP